MYLKLTTPYNPGMNDPGNTYPLLYITQLTDNRTGANFSFVYEAGNFVTVTDNNGVSTSVWSKGIGMLAQIATVGGTDYTAATQAVAPNATDSAYESIYRILYTKLVSEGFAGTIVSP